MPLNINHDLYEHKITALLGRQAAASVTLTHLKTLGHMNDLWCRADRSPG